MPVHDHKDIKTVQLLTHQSDFITMSCYYNSITLKLNRL